MLWHSTSDVNFYKSLHFLQSQSWLAQPISCTCTFKSFIVYKSLWGLINHQKSLRIKFISIIQCSTSQYNTVQFIVVQFNWVQHITEQCCTIGYSTLHSSTVQLGTAHYRTVLYNWVQHITEQYCTIGYNRLQNSSVQLGTAH